MQNEFQVLSENIEQYLKYPLSKYLLHYRLTNMTFQYYHQHLEDIVTQELLVRVVVLLELSQLQDPEVNAIRVLDLFYVVSGYQKGCLQTDLLERQLFVVRVELLDFQLEGHGFFKTYGQLLVFQVN